MLSPPVALKALGDLLLTAMDPGISQDGEDLGDEYPELGDGFMSDSEGQVGQIAFFVGNPASLRFSTSYSKDHMGSLGISIEELRDMIKNQVPKHS